MKSPHIFAAVLFAVASASNAQTASAPASSVDQAAQTPASAPKTDGEVRKVDLEQGKVTLRHGPIENLEMPAMTMVFKAAEPKLLESLKVGDKVKFTAEKVNGAFTVTAIQPAR
jgi:Cu/Ag efflux protein CusF